MSCLRAKHHLRRGWKVEIPSSSNFTRRWLKIDRNTGDDLDARLQRRWPRSAKSKHWRWTCSKSIRSAVRKYRNRANNNNNGMHDFWLHAQPQRGAWLSTTQHSTTPPLHRLYEYPAHQPQLGITRSKKPLSRLATKTCIRASVALDP